MTPKSTKKTTAVALMGSLALAMSLLSNMAVAEVASKVPQKPDLSHPGDASPWPNYGETPDTNTPEVKAWVKSVDWSKVPKLPVRKTTSPGDPPECPKKGITESDCWWTCQGCFAPDDVVDCPSKKAWGLTFDDGPQPGTTENLLALLQEKNVTATFFVTGMKSARAPWLLQDTLDQGHHLASHTWSHSGLTTLTNEQIVAELKWTEKFILEHTGYKVKYYRPPYGDVDNRVRAIARELGFKTVIWSSDWDTQDWQLEENTITSKQIVGIFKNDLQSLPQRDQGVITLEHDGDPKMTTMARTLLEMGLAKGMQPMDIAKCLGDNVGYNAVPTSHVNKQPDAAQDQKQPQQPQGPKPKDISNHDQSAPNKDTNNQGQSNPKDDTQKGVFDDNSTFQGQGGVDPMTQASAAVSIRAGLSVACWTLAAVVASFVF
ncbi:chitin deacetylase [Mortierella claussenii]|nr:chitin deacetylase [Mortierella claussenii]